MQQYKLTFLNKLDFIVKAQNFESANDITALAHAYTLCGIDMIEVTHARRRVGEITKGGPVGAPLPELPRRAPGIFNMGAQTVPHPPAPYHQGGRQPLGRNAMSDSWLSGGSTDARQVHA